MKRILITGGTGLIGKELTTVLLEKGYGVTILTRQKKEDQGNILYKRWDVTNSFIESDTFKDVHHIIHLAGAGVADKRWTNSYKKMLYDSRIKTADFIALSLPDNHTIESFISASGIAYYGSETSQEIFSEEDEPGTDFLAQLTVSWEKAADQFLNKVDRVVKYRTPVVMSDKGGALPTIAKPIKLSAGSPLASGDQYIPWIDIDDVVASYLFAIENDINGAYNVVAKEHLTNKELTYRIAEYINKKIWLPNVPEFALKLLLGERAIIVTDGSRANGQKLAAEGFKYIHETLKLNTFNL